MGSYDSSDWSPSSRSSSSSAGSDSYTPRRSTRKQPSPDLERQVNNIISGAGGSGSSSDGSSGSAGTSSNSASASQGNYDPSLKTIVALGGGLTPKRIVSPIPTNLESFTEVMNYLMGSEVAATSEDRAIVDAVNQRLSKPDSMIVVNDQVRYGIGRAGSSIRPYMQRKTHTLDDGTAMPFQYVDLAVLTHDEGGIKHRYNGLERKLM